MKKSKKKTNLYWCAGCHCAIERESDSKTVKSMCERAGRDVRMVRIDTIQKLK